MNSWLKFLADRGPPLQWRYVSSPHNEKSTDTISYCVRIGLRLVYLPVHRQCSHLLCPGLFPGVTPFRRACGAHVVPETLSLHIPVVLRGMDKGTLRPLTLHVPYNGHEYCRSQLEAHSFSYKPIPTGKKGNALPCCVLFILVRKLRPVPTNRR